MINRLLAQAVSAEGMAEAQARADALFLSIGVGAIATDEHGNIYRVNDVAADILDMDKEELMGQWFTKTVQATHEDGTTIPVTERPITKAFLTGKSVSEKTYYRTKSGDRVPVSVTVSPIMLHDKPVGAVEVFYDSTLEDEVDRMKSEFISIASHQLRTPLSAINTYANLLLGGYEGDLTKGQQDQMRIILSAVERMNDLISTLLDVSKLESGKLNVRFQKVTMTELLAEIMQELTALAESKNLNVTVKSPKRELEIYTDPLLVGEVFTNLLSNAIKYTPEEGTIEVSLRRLRGEMIFRVKDSGYGIPESMKGQIFKKFFRATNVQRQETSGSGLGLYMVKQVADVLGGNLWFKSVENQGSTFCFALPITEPPKD